MRRSTVIFLMAMTSAGAGASADADLPGRISFGFNVGGCHSANDHELWSGSGAGYAYFGEVAYEPASWLVAPELQWGYTYASGDAPAREGEEYPVPPTELKGEGDTFLMGGRARVPLWRMRLRPYAGGGAVWTNYHRIVMDNSDVLSDKGSFGTGWAALAGLEFFPDPATGFSLVVEYRYASTRQEWREPVRSWNKGAFDPKFNLTEKLVTLGVKVYTL